MVLNVSEMEAKVQEATNDDPWLVVPCIEIGACVLILSTGVQVRRLWAK